MPTIPNFPAIDLALAPSSIFQVTISKDHSVKQAHLEEIVQNILADGKPRKLRLYFIVPSDIYDDFPLQNLLNVDGKKAQKVPKVIREYVTQWAVKLDINSAARGLSPGIGDGDPY